MKSRMQQRPRVDYMRASVDSGEGLVMISHCQNMTGTGFAWLFSTNKKHVKEG